MKTIKIFLASSEELTDDRNAFGNLVRRLDKIYEKRGIRIELFEWEDYDAAYNDRRKQDEYNDQIKVSDMFLALFHTKAGRFTIEEFNIATEEFKKHASPKVYTYCKDLQVGEQESLELVDFKRKLFEEMGHYWSRYNNRDSMQLNFVMQLQLVESSGMVEKLKLEDGTVMLGSMPIAKIDNLQFAAGNEAYQKMSAELASLPEKIEKARQRVEKFADDEDLRDDLQQKLNRYNNLKEEFAELQKKLFETAQRIAAMQLEQVSDMLRRAIEAFEDGNIERANTLLDEIAHEAEHHMEQLEQQRSLVHQDIDAFLLQAKTVMADVNIPITERKERVVSIYGKADEWAEKSALDKEKYDSLLDNYALFLHDNAFYSEAEAVYLRLISIREAMHGKEDPSTAFAYNNIGCVYDSLGDYTKALEYFKRALTIFRENDSDTAESYSNIGSVYHRQGVYHKALEYYDKALIIQEKVYGTEHPAIAIYYNNIGGAYNSIGDYTKALWFFQKALVIYDGSEHLGTAATYENIGNVYQGKGDYPKALEYQFKALAIREKFLGSEHPETSNSYNNIAGAYNRQGDYPNAEMYYYKAIGIRIKVFGMNHPETAGSFLNLGSVCLKQGDYNSAYYYSEMALKTFEAIFGLEHPSTADSYDNIGGILTQQEKYSEALKYLLKAMAIREKVLGLEHPSTANSYQNVGYNYLCQYNSSKALEYYQKSLAIREKVFGLEHLSTAQAYNDIGAAFFLQGNGAKALEYLNKSMDIHVKMLGPEHPLTIAINEKIDNIKNNISSALWSLKQKAARWLIVICMKLFNSKS